MSDAPERIWLDWSDDQKPEWVHQLLAFKEGIELDGEQASIPYVPEADLLAAQSRIAELEDVWARVWKEQDRAWSNAAQARIAELEAALRKIEHSAKWCKPFDFIREGSLGFIEGVARRALEAKP